MLSNDQITRCVDLFHQELTGAELMLDFDRITSIDVHQLLTDVIDDEIGCDPRWSRFEWDIARAQCVLEHDRQAAKRRRTTVPSPWGPPYAERSEQWVDRADYEDSRASDEMLRGEARK